MAIVFVPLPLCARVEMIFLQNGQFIQNVYHVKSGGNLDAADLTRIAAKVLAWWNANAKVYTSSTCSLQRIEVIDASVNNGAGIIYSTTLPTAGTGAASSLPNSVTIAVKLNTGFTGRSFRGRIYHCGIVPSWVVGNVLQAGVQASAQGVYNALITALAAGSPSDALVVGSKRANNAWRVTGVATPVTTTSVENNVDNQRRRLTGPGRGT